MTYSHNLITEHKAPCETEPRQCYQGSCKYYSVLQSNCFYHEIQARLSAEQGMNLFSTRLFAEVCQDAKINSPVRANTEKPLENTFSKRKGGTHEAHIK